MARVRFKLDFVVDFKDRTSIPSVPVPNNLFEGVVRIFLMEDETAFIEPDGLVETTLLGPQGKWMWRPSKKNRSRS